MFTGALTLTTFGSSVKIYLNKALKTWLCRIEVLSPASLVTCIEKVAQCTRQSCPIIIGIVDALI